MDAVLVNGVLLGRSGQELVRDEHCRGGKESCNTVSNVKGGRRTMRIACACLGGGWSTAGEVHALDDMDAARHLGTGFWQEITRRGERRQDGAHTAISVLLLLLLLLRTHTRTHAHTRTDNVSSTRKKIWAARRREGGREVFLLAASPVKKTEVSHQKYFMGAMVVDPR